MTTQTLLRLRELKLGGMAGALEQQLQQTDTFEALPFVERLSLLLEQECLQRENRKAFIRKAVIVGIIFVLLIYFIGFAKF